MKLIICEKPSLAKNVKNAVSQRESVLVKEIPSSDKNKCIYYESRNYIITYAFGHLFSFGEPENYLPERSDKGWDISDLPIIPEQFRLYPIDSSCKKQFQLIAALISRADVSEIVHCGDADREGEIIVRNILRIARNTKPVSRLWLPEQTESSILSALDSSEPDSKYDDLANAGYARTFVDWLMGYNLTRYLTLKIGAAKAWGAGRVLIPIVEAIYLRELAIRSFVSVPYYQVEGAFTKSGLTVELTDSAKFDDADEAVCRQRQLSAMRFSVESISSKEAIISPPKLFSLDTLQGKLSKDYDMTLEMSMPIIQKLYESAYITYPRSDTEYFAEAEKEPVFAVIDKINSAKGLDLEHKEAKRIFDSSKVESHSAIRPTTKLPVDLNENEKRVYDTVFNRFCAVFAPPCKVTRTTVVISSGSDKFTIKGDVPLSSGFRAYEPAASSDKDKSLPEFSEGESLTIEWKVKEKKTKAPSRYTVDSLNAYLKEPFRNDTSSDVQGSDDDRELYNNIRKGIEIGTVATRTAIITKAAKEYKYISIRNGQYSCTEKGEAFIEYLKALNIDLFKERNVEFNVMLKEVENGKKTIEDAIAETSDELRRIISQTAEVSAAQKYDSDNIGKCPYCGAEISDGKNSFYCSGYKTGCGFKLWKKSYCKLSFAKDGKNIEYTKPVTITKSNAKSLLKSGMTTVSIEEKNGKGKYKVSITFDPKGNNKIISSGRVMDKKK